MKADGTKTNPTQPGDTIPLPRSPQRNSSRRAAILAVAVDLFATKGYHGVSMDDIGSAAGVTGPALYHHFVGKEAMLVAAISPVSEGLLTGARQLSARYTGNGPALVSALVEFHVEFAVDNPAVITLNTHELDRLPKESRDTIRDVQRAYVAEWMAALKLLHSDWSDERARTAALATFGLMNSTPFLSVTSARTETGQLLRTMALAALALN